MLELKQERVDEQAAKRLMRRAGEEAIYQQALALLEPSDRELLALCESGQVSSAAIATLLRCHRATIHRRVRRIQRRLSSPIALMVAAAWRDMPRTWREVAIAVHIRGEQRTRVASRLGLCRREIASILAGIEGWFHARRALRLQMARTQEQQ